MRHGDWLLERYMYIVVLRLLGCSPPFPLGSGWYYYLTKNPRGSVLVPESPEKRNVRYLPGCEQSPLMAPLPNTSLFCLS